MKSQKNLRLFNIIYDVDYLVVVIFANVVALLAVLEIEKQKLNYAIKFI